MTTISSFEMKTGASMPKTLRLTSQATYQRAHRDAPTHGTATTVYDSTIGASAIEAAAKCPDERAAAKRHVMVHEVAQKFTADDYDRLKADVALSDTSTTLARSSASSPLGKSVPLEATFSGRPELQVTSFAELSHKLEKGERHGIQGAMVKEFFAGGSIEGPFAGARSAQGEWMASTFFAHARPFGGAFATLKPSQYSDSGYKLHNYSRVG